MAQLFSPAANTWVRVVLVTGGLLLVLAPFAVWATVRTPIGTGQYASLRQPIPFSHPLHVNGLRIDCRYCHATVERAPNAGFPPTRTCVPCHDARLMNSPLLAPVRESIQTRQPIAWQRVTRLPDFVFFNHAVHMRVGAECTTCHGPVHLMRNVYQAQPLSMEWCVDCHRRPERYVPALAQTAAIRRLTSCTTCHR